VIFHPQLHICT